MNKPPLDEKQLEELKKKLGIDEKIAAMYNVSVYKVEKELDPRLRKIILRYIEQSESQNEKNTP